MLFHRVFILVCLGPALSAAAAELEGPEDCRRVDDDRDRLACYDRLYPREPRLAEGAKESAQSTGTVAQDPVEALSPDPAAVEEFGAEQIIQSVDHLEARLVGDFDGWSGNTVFRLDNGQVWQQTKNYIPDYKPRDPVSQPRVTISRGFMGSYNLQVEGVKRIVQVKRIE